MDEDDPLEDQLTLERMLHLEEWSTNLRFKPATVVRFAGRAGEVITITKNDGQVRYDNHTYSSRLGPRALGNPYYPFCSRIDWEWAKLRGIGDTAFSASLAILGVSTVQISS